MHKISNIGEHCVCLELLPENATVLDAGCRGFTLDDFFYSRTNSKVINADIDNLENGIPFEIDPVHKNIKPVAYSKINSDTPYHDYLKIGISNYNGLGEVKPCAIDPQATELLISSKSPEIPVHVYTTERLKQLLNIEWWDFIKLDIEGEEYQILETGLHPMATQVSVEFHEHTSRAIGKEKLDELLDKLSRWYYIYNRNWESRHGAGFNYWDVLLIAKA